VVTEEEGRAKRLTCPYHAWTFDHRGTLVGIAGRETFGEVDPDLGLAELPCEERAGMVFVSLTPSDESMAIDDWLAGVDTTVFEPFAMGEWHLFSRRELVGANWKVAYDGYLEGYHFASLHRTTIFTSVMSNVMAYDAYGPHQRIAFARHGIEKQRDVPEEQWGDWDGLSLITVLFPNVSFAFGSEGCLVSQLLPGPTPDRSRTIQSYYRCRPIDTDDERGRAQAESDRYFEVVRDEDYSTGLGIQAGLATDANREFVFGRNEVGPQRFHRAVAAHLD
jgi:phenylpropionate dioxygenase-like ring-hydroxylating dioxygenase large terminal subunit